MTSAAAALNQRLLFFKIPYLDGVGCSIPRAVGSAAVELDVVRRLQPEGPEYPKVNGQKAIPDNAFDSASITKQPCLSCEVEVAAGRMGMR